MSLHNHPGFLGFTSQGVIAIHADWPIYPEEHGPDLALLWLTAFPEGAAFKRIDDIDRCTLFVTDVKHSNRGDPFDSRNFHVAIWHEDLLDLAAQSFVDGLSSVSERRWEELRRSELPADPLFTKLSGGGFKQIELPALHEYDEEDVSWPEFSSGGVRVTSEGRSRAASMLAEVGEDLAILGVRIQRLVDLAFFDTAVREACVTLEHRIKQWLDSERYGDALVQNFIARLRERDGYMESYLRVLRGQLRMTFKFIRNDFMHNFIDVDETQCRAILFRVARVQAVVEELTA